MNIKMVLLWIVIYSVSGIFGRFCHKPKWAKTVLLSSVIIKTGIFTYAFLIVFLNDFPSVFEIWRNKNISNLEPAEAVILIGLVLAVMDIIDSYLEYVDVARG